MEQRKIDLKKSDFWVCPLGHESMNQVWTHYIVYRKGKYKMEWQAYCAVCYAEFWKGKLEKVVKKRA